ncbi:cytochrome c biogenesis heme-transporting ATPase CcmA [Candidatus Nitrotoga fabula]|uniref:Heme trafficking system ATP-binding protein n=1 Tax=Candidatus Nitrotoga fabula TaxID=2182327 RepID=A0A916BF46_9PROT|nr:cytochrome c biogenesis heme-transporting ATPase CcmA [Candidatus Nitrotoga fabula]MCE7917799.1 cytochrome c biogenesis heme-transporting ATPase CcmA [Nitrosomonas sp. PRO5]CAE6730505.1 heme trafficking system ATP-binding protein [Candidatus Nitrotoga fabula]
MLEISNLACNRGDHLLFSDLNFSISAGQLLQVQGANGSGKTSLLRTLCGLVIPAMGEIKWRGQDIHELDEKFYAEMIYLGHSNAIKDELNAVENLRISAGLAGCKLDDKQIIAALRRMGLRGREMLPVRVLSQGQCRRVALARLLLINVSLWILDEPLTALDVSAVGLMQELIGEHLANKGMVIYTTHQPLEVAGVETQRLALS